MSEEQKSPLKEIVQPFVDLVHAPRALWGINLGYLLEGFVYFGMLGYLAMHFSDFVFLGVDRADEYSHLMVGVLTAGITIAMFFLGFVPDRFGVRKALIWAFGLLVIGRVVIAAAPTLLGLDPAGLMSPLHIVTMGGILLVVIGYGMYQPAAYAAVRQFTNPETAAMGFAMLYALMNLGGFLPSYAFLLRDDDYLGLGITGTFWFYAAVTVVALIATVVLLSPSTVKRAIATAKAETASMLAKKGEEKKDEGGETKKVELIDRPIPIHMWASMVVAWGLLLRLVLVYLPGNWMNIGVGLLALAPLVLFWKKARVWIANHPMADGKFYFFIFALIPVQTLFTYNWLILPQYINRSYEGWIGEYFEIGSNFNPLLIFVLVPIVTALTQKRNVYNMMIWGTFIMAAPAFLLAFGTTWYTLFGYILIMTVGEAMWQPRFLQYAAEIAPEGRTGIYMGVAQFPWFLTKLIVPLYSGIMIGNFVPAEGMKNPEGMWLIFACIAMVSTVLLVIAKPWLGKDFKTKHEG